MLTIAPSGLTRGRASAALVAGLCLTLPVVAARAGPPRTAVWTEPLATWILGLGDVLYLDAGLEHRFAGGRHLSADFVFTHGDNYKCSSVTTGAQASAGFVVAAGEPEPADGFFFQPKVRARWFTTTVPAAMSGGNPCSNPEVAGDEVELGLGLDAGYQWFSGSVYAAIALGPNGGYCWNCQKSAAFLANGGSSGDRVNRMVFGFNGTLLRLGVAF